jgi:hypothetical protein
LFGRFNLAQGARDRVAIAVANDDKLLPRIMAAQQVLMRRCGAR